MLGQPRIDSVKRLGAISVLRALLALKPLVKLASLLKTLEQKFPSAFLKMNKRALELGLNPDIVNVNGGAIALGHPLGGTGAKLTVQIMHEARRRKAKHVMVTMCIGGGMGAAGIFENIIN